MNMNENPIYPYLKGFIFIVTYGRSGSTLLQKIIQTIPRACIRGENNSTLIPLFRAHKRAKYAHDTFGKEPTKRDDPWYGAELINYQSLGKMLADAYLYSVLTPPRNSCWIGNKEIRYDEVGEELVELMDFIRTYFNNAFIIFNSRNVDEVKRSGWWKNVDEKEVEERISKMDERFAAYTKRAPDCTFHAHHELTRDDPAYLKPLFAMMGEEMDMEKVLSCLEKKLRH